jgi:hypothetical protein
LWTGNDWTETASIAEKDVATRLLVDLTAILTPIVVYQTDKSPFGFATDQKQPSERPLKFDDLVVIYNSTPGFVSDKLKAVLENVAALLKGTKVKGVVFAYDEAQNLSDHRDTNQFPLSLVVDVFVSLQKKQLSCQFLLVLTGLPTLVTKLNEARTFTERMFHTLVLDRLKVSEAREAIVRPIAIEKSTLGFSDQAIQSIISESKGYPFLIQYICKEVFDAWIGKMTVGLAPSVPMAEITAKLDIDFFAPRWSRATDRQQTFMQVIATLRSSDDEFTIQEITTASRQLLSRPIGASHANQMLGHLAEKGLIYRNRRGAYCFAVPLLASFIRRQSWDPMSTRQAQQIA